LSDVSTIVTDRLLLTPLLVDDAEEMVEVLADPALAAARVRNRGDDCCR
jgi:hypothetical protein